MMKKQLLIISMALLSAGNSKAQTFDTLATFIVPNHLALGVAFDYVNNYYVISSGGQSNTLNTDNVFLRYDLNFNLVDSIAEPPGAAANGFGIRDLAFDGTFIYGSYDNQVQQFDAANLQSVNSFTGQNNPNRGMAVDSDLTVFSTNFATGPIAHFTNAGVLINSCPNTTVTASAPYGLAVDNWTQPGTKRLWMNTPSLAGGGIFLTRYDYANCIIDTNVDLSALVPPSSDLATSTSGGLDIINNHPNYPGKIIGIVLGQNNPTAFVMLIDMTPPAPILNDSCITSVDLTSSLGQPIGVTQTTGPYNNDSASTGTDDPVIGFECYGEPDGTGTAPTLDNTLWYSFTGDGGLYFIETGTCAGVTNYIDDGDTQISIYEGTCGALIPVLCSEDGPSATGATFPAGDTLQTTAGTVYYMIIDGFNFSGALSTGEFCVNITQLLSVGINEHSNNGDLGLTNLYPVPAKDKVTFTLNVKEYIAVMISVQDNLGREVLSQPLNAVKGENKMTLDLSKQTAGVYFITVKSNESIVVSKFIKE